MAGWVLVEREAAVSGERLAAVLAVVLTVVTGSMDALTFTRLGEVFSSVMTGNVVLLGVSAGREDGTLAGHVAVAVCSFVVGVIVGSRVAGAPSDDRPVWPARVTAALAVELVVLAGLFAGWAVTGGRPSGWVQGVLLGAAAVAMGIQTGAVRGIGLSGLSTTYMTGTLSGVLADIVTGGRVRWRGVLLLAALFVGAGGGALLVVNAATVAPALPVGLLAVVLVAAQWQRARVR